MDEETVECERCGIEGIKGHMKQFNGEWYCEFHHIVVWIENEGEA